MLTGRENIYINGSILGLSSREIDQKLDNIIEFSELGDFRDSPVKYYSSGMYVRLGFAVAAHMDPDVLFVDEILAVGDAEFQKKCLATMDDLRTGGRTVLFVSHNMAAIEMPYEYRPLPEKGETVIALDRAGQKIGEAVITAIKQTKKMDQTATVIVELPREWSMTARAILLKR